jgi:hypothetical protein
MEEDILPFDSDKPIYNRTHIQLATFFGGPLAIIYILAENFKQLGQPEKVKRTWFIGIISLLLVITLGSFIPETWKIPTLVFPLIFLSVGAAIMHRIQGNEIKNHTDNGGPVYSLWRAVVVGSVCLLIMLAFLFVVAEIMDKGFVPGNGVKP